MSRERRSHGRDVNGTPHPLGGAHSPLPRRTTGPQQGDPRVVTTDRREPPSASRTKATTASATSVAGGGHTGFIRQHAKLLLVERAVHRLVISGAATSRPC